MLSDTPVLTIILVNQCVNDSDVTSLVNLEVDSCQLNVYRHYLTCTSSSVEVDSNLTRLISILEEVLSRTSDVQNIIHTTYGTSINDLSLPAKRSVHNVDILNCVVDSERNSNSLSNLNVNSRLSSLELNELSVSYVERCAVSQSEGNRTILVNNYTLEYASTRNLLCRKLSANPVCTTVDRYIQLTVLANLQLKVTSTRLALSSENRNVLAVNLEKVVVLTIYKYCPVVNAV